MISAEYCRAMARYNQWQNTDLRRAMDTLDWAELTSDRGSFFGSIWATANHLLWGDTIWMSRFDGWDKPRQSIAESAEFIKDRAMWSAARAQADAGIRRWADTLQDVRLDGDLSWFSGAAGRDVTKPMALCVTHFFNHQTHHRGQIHGMLTQAGWETAPSDLFLMPEEP